LRIPAARLQVTGTVRCVERDSDSGLRRQSGFHLACGVWHGAARSDEINATAGTLDDTRWLQPAGHIWTVSKQSLLPIPVGELSFPGQPASGCEELTERWRLMFGFDPPDQG